MKSYNATRDGNELVVTVNGRELNPRLDLWNHSSSGFECGYTGSGPAQLALAVLADCLEEDRKAVELHQAFKLEVIAKLPRNGWMLTKSEIKEALHACTRN